MNDGRQRVTATVSLKEDSILLEACKMGGKLQELIKGETAYITKVDGELDPLSGIDVYRNALIPSESCIVGIIESATIVNTEGSFANLTLVYRLTSNHPEDNYVCLVPRIGVLSHLSEDPMCFGFDAHCVAGVMSMATWDLGVTVDHFERVCQEIEEMPPESSELLTNIDGSKVAWRTTHIEAPNYMEPQHAIVLCGASVLHDTVLLSLTSEEVLTSADTVVAHCSTFDETKEFTLVLSKAMRVTEK